MIELFLSSDGKHTVHVSTETPELAPRAKAPYEMIIESCGNKARMWQLAIDKEPPRLKNASQIASKAENGDDQTPICPIHRRRMKLLHGRYGTFWSCKAYSAQDAWCKHTVDIPDKSGGSSYVA